MGLKSNHEPNIIWNWVVYYHVSCTSTISQSTNSFHNSKWIKLICDQMTLNDKIQDEQIYFNMVECMKYTINNIQNTTNNHSTLTLWFNVYASTKNVT